MNATCPRCNSLIEPNSSFCTNCGAVLAAQNPYQQPGTPSAPQNPYQQPYGQQSQVPPWPSAGNAGYAPYQQSQQATAAQKETASGGTVSLCGQGDTPATTNPTIWNHR